NYSKPDGKLLFHFKFLANKDQADEEQIDRQQYTRIFFDGRPGPFHVAAPVDVVEDQHRGTGRMREDGLEIAQGRLVAVIAVDEDEVHRRNALEQGAELGIEITRYDPGLASQRPQVFARSSCKGR